VVTVTAVRAVLLSHEYEASPRLAWVGGHIDTWDAALVEVTCSDGTRGIGEVAQGIMGAVAVPGIVDALVPMVVGLDAERPLESVASVRDRTLFWARGGITSGVIAAVEQALWDAAGIREGRPVHDLLGGAQRSEIELYASGGLGTTTDEIVAWARAQEDAGLATVKFRAMRSAARTIELLHEVTAALRPGTRFVIDAVQGCASRPWSWDDAVAVGQVAGDLGARWYEEPCRADDVAGYAHVRALVDVPVSGVESFTTVDDFERLFDHDGVDIAQPDAAMVGGPSQLQRVATSATSRGLATVPHVWGTGVTLMANLHTAFATPGMDLVELCTIPNPLREDLLVEPFTHAGSRVPLPRGPGLGVALTPEIEARYPFRPGRGHVIA